MISRTHRISKTLDAPLRFVYKWCTDFREDDGKLTGSTARRHIVDKSKRRVCWVSHYTDPKTGSELEGIRIVDLKPPNAWHLDAVGEDYLEIADYHLTAVGKGKTKLDMTMRLKYKEAPDQTKEEWENGTSNQWDTYKAVLEKEYSES